MISVVRFRLALRLSVLLPALLFAAFTPIVYGGVFTAIVRLLNDRLRIDLFLLCVLHLTLLRGERRTVHDLLHTLRRG